MLTTNRFATLTAVTLEMLDKSSLITVEYIDWHEDTQSKTGLDSATLQLKQMHPEVPPVFVRGNTRPCVTD